MTTLFDHQDVELADVTVKSADGPLRTLSTTQNHPFWDATTRSWVEAAQLAPGVSKVRDVNGAEVVVAAVRSYAGLAEMRDLTVDTTHTYYVLAGNTPVLVHNDGGELTPEQLKSVRSLEARIAEHQTKLDAYKADPWAYDNQGLLKNAPNDEVRQRIINGRVKHLEKEIGGFQKQVDNLKSLGGMC